MTTIFFKIKSSGGDNVYLVTASDEEKDLTFECTCPAGEWMQFCKHRQQLMEGNFKNCMEQPSEEDKTTLKNMLANTPWLHELMAAIAAAEKDVEKAKKKVRALKGELGRRLGGS